MKLFIALILLCSTTFAQEKKDTVVWIPKAQIIQVLENQKRELQDDIKMVEGKLEFLYVMPDSIQIKRKK
jgi:hypothetical protein